MTVLVTIVTMGRSTAALQAVEARPTFMKRPGHIYVTLWLLFLLWGCALTCHVIFVLAISGDYSTSSYRLAKMRRTDGGIIVDTVYTSIAFGPAMGLLVGVVAVL